MVGVGEDPLDAPTVHAAERLKSLHVTVGLGNPREMAATNSGEDFTPGGPGKRLWGRRRKPKCGALMHLMDQGQYWQRGGNPLLVAQNKANEIHVRGRDQPRSYGGAALSLIHI